jgi:hypothetical protein
MLMYICLRLARMIAQPDHLIVRPNLGGSRYDGSAVGVLRSVLLTGGERRKSEIGRLPRNRVLSSGHPELHTYTIYLNCRGSQSRETWHNENIDGMIISLTIQSEQGAEA